MSRRTSVSLMLLLLVATIVISVTAYIFIKGYVGKLIPSFSRKIVTK